MKNIKEKIDYIYINIEAIYYFFSNTGISDYSKRCILRRIFILLDSYINVIGFFKNHLARKGQIKRNSKMDIEKIIKEIEVEWNNNYEVIRNKFSAHHQNIDELFLIDWWNEIDYSTITFFYEKINEIKSILIENSCISPSYITDFSNLDFSGTCLEEINETDFYLSHGRLALSKKNTTGMTPFSEFQRKCMLINTIIDLISINCAITLKTQNCDSLYKTILFNSAWLLIFCDTWSLVENIYDDGDYGNSLLTLSPPNWKGRIIIAQGNSQRNRTFEQKFKELRCKFAAHIDTEENIITLQNEFYQFNLQFLHEYFIQNLRIFRKACFSDISTKMFAMPDIKYPHNDIIGLSYTEYKPVSN
jgi:hypothetical protein